MAKSLDAGAWVPILASLRSSRGKCWEGCAGQWAEKSIVMSTADTIWKGTW